MQHFDDKDFGLCFSQSAELSACGLEDIELVAQKLNVRPRKTLGRKPWPSVCVIYY